MATRKYSRIGAAAMLAMAAVSGMSTHALAQDKDQDRVQLRDQDRIYGSELMTEQERNEHRNRLRSMKTEPERDAYRLEHHQRMQERARARGAKLPDEPIMRQGMGGAGAGAGKGR